MSKIIFDDESYLCYGSGNFDNWCVYHVFVSGKKVAPKDRDCFYELRKCTELFDAYDIYDDFLVIYDMTGKIFDEAVVDVIRKISLKYGLCQETILKNFSIIYMAMIAEENKLFTKLGKRIKRLGMYYLLVKGKSPDYCANFIRGKNFKEIDALCSSGGF